MSIPEGIETITAEGGDLKSAVAAAAEQLGVETNFVGHKLDLSHFRSATGGMVPRDTVKIIAWKSESEVKSVAAPARAPRKRDDDEDGGGEREERRSRGRKERSDRGDRDDRRSRDRDDRRGRGRDRGDRGDRGDRDDRRSRGKDRDRDEKPRRRGAEAEATEASDYAAAWMETLLGHLGLEGTVTGTGSDDRIHLDLKIDGKAGRLIGKRGATLRSVRRLLKGALENHHGEFELDVDVNDDRPRNEERSSDDDDGGRKRGRGRGRRDRRDRGGDKGKYPEEQLTELAVKAAAKARQTGQTITITLDLNSYDRRVVHVAIADEDGVRSQSEERTVTDDDGNERTVKYVQVIPADDGEE